MRISWNDTFALHMATNLNIWIFGHSIDQNADNWEWHWTAFAILAMFGWWLPIEVDQWSMTTSVSTSNCMILMGVGHPKLGKFYICDMCAFSLQTTFKYVTSSKTCSKMFSYASLWCRVDLRGRNIQLYWKFWDFFPLEISNIRRTLDKVWSRNLLLRFL